MSYFQRHLRNYEANQGRMSSNKGQTPVLRNKKMNCQRVKTQYSGQLTKRNIREDSSIVKPQYLGRKQPEPKKVIKVPMRFATEGLGQTDNPDESMKAIFAEADNSMEQMLNSSLKHFDTRFDSLMQRRDILSEQNNELVEQNQQLKEAVAQLMNILRNKLDQALRKQENELKGVLADYLQLITKLLGDKEQLTSTLQISEKELSHAKQEINNLQTKLQECELQQLQKNEQIIELIKELQRYKKDEIKQQTLEQRISNQNNKIQTLYQLLQHSEDERKYLQERLQMLQSDQKYKLLQADFEARMAEKEREFDEIIQQYEKVTNETIKQKNNEIYRLKRNFQSRVEISQYVQLHQN